MSEVQESEYELQEKYTFFITWQPSWDIPWNKFEGDIKILMNLRSMVPRQLQPSGTLQTFVKKIRNLQFC